MKLLTPVGDPAQLAAAARAGASEVLLGHCELARLGALDASELQSLAVAARDFGLRPILEWDALLTEPAMARSRSVLASLDLSLFAAVRVQDPGAFELVLSPPAELAELRKLGVQLVLESGSHNLRAVRRWCTYGGDRLERVALSLELPGTRVAEIIRAVSTPVELLALGPIALFHSPRRLLSPLFPSEDRDDVAAWMLSDDARNHHELRARASCTEDGHSGFRVRENRHGTFLFHSKDYCLLDRVEELREMGLAFARVDLRLLPEPGLASPLLDAAAKVVANGRNIEGEAFKQNYPVRVLRCFFQTNLTDTLVKRLKNPETQRRDDGYLGRVVEAVKGERLVLHLLGKGASLRTGDRIVLVTPEGQEHEHVVDTMTGLDLRPLTEVRKGDYLILPHIKSITAESTVRR